MVLKKPVLNKGWCVSVEERRTREHI